MSDPYDLQRFVTAQDRGGTYDDALAELRAGLKRSHWMWFVFPQIAGLGSSPNARHFAMSGLPEAAAFLQHPVLGARLLECCRVLAELPGSDPVRVLGVIDARKLHSCVTLFARAAPEQPIFGAVVDKYFGRELDQPTLDRL